MLREVMYEVCSVDFALFGEAGLEPGLLHWDRLGVLTQQILELLVHTQRHDHVGSAAGFIY